jgi:hypothetical protein
VVLDVCFRRVSPVAVGPGEGRFSRPITANQAQRRELVFMPQSGHHCWSEYSDCVDGVGQGDRRVDRFAVMTSFAPRCAACGHV